MKTIFKPFATAVILLLLGNALNAQQQDLATKTGSAVNTNTNSQAPVQAIPSGGSEDIATTVPVKSGATQAAPNVAVTEPKVLHAGDVDATTGQKIVVAPVKAAAVAKTTGNVAPKVNAEKAVYTEGPNKGKLIHPEAQQQTKVMPDPAKQTAEKAAVAKQQEVNQVKATTLTSEQRTANEAARKAEMEKVKK